MSSARSRFLRAPSKSPSCVWTSAMRQRTHASAPRSPCGGHPIQRVLEQRQGPRVIPEVRVAAAEVARHATDAARHGASEAKLELPLEQLHRLGVAPEHVLRAACASEGARDQARSSDPLRDLECPDLVVVSEADLPHPSSREGRVVERPHEPGRPVQRLGMAQCRGVRLERRRCLPPAVQGLASHGVEAHRPDRRAAKEG